MGELFHSVLFAYQKTVKDILGSGEAALLHPVLDKINLATYKHSPSLLEEEYIDKILENFLEDILKSGAVKWIDIEEIENGKFILHIKGCIYSKGIHEFLNTKDTTCPLALTIMAFIQAATGRKVRPTDSEYTSNGTNTLIEFLAPTKEEKIITIA